MIMSRAGAPIESIRQALGNPSHALWVLLQQGASRGFVAVKFLLLARMLGPDKVGVITAALIAISIGETLTDPGLAQAIIQKRTPPSASEQHAAWTALLLRGAIIGVFLLVLAPFLAAAFRAPAATPLIRWAAVVPVLRNASSIKIPMALRNRNFRAVGILQASASLVDLAAATTSVYFTHDLRAVIWAASLADATRTIGSHILFKTLPRINAHLEMIRDLSRFGRWVWSTNITTFVLNQSDKIIAAGFLGAAGLGIYQMAYKLAQLLIADLGIAIGQYLYPTFSRRHHEDSEATRLTLVWLLVSMLAIALPLILSLVLVAPWLMTAALGKQWSESVQVFRVLLPTMAVGVLIITLVSYVRSIGSPEKATRATILQLVLFVSAAVFFTPRKGLLGLAIAVLIGALGSVTYLVVASGATLADLNRLKLPVSRITAILATSLTSIVFLQVLTWHVYPQALVLGTTLLVMVNVFRRNREALAEG